MDQTTEIEQTAGKPLSPWQPMTSALDIKHLGKLLEELNETGAAAARCLIQGINEAEPVTGVINRQWLEDEMADVQACILLVVQHFGLNRICMTRRMAKKMKHLKAWHKL